MCYVIPPKVLVGVFRLGFVMRSSCHSVLSALPVCVGKLGIAEFCPKNTPPYYRSIHIDPNIDQSVWIEHRSSEIGPRTRLARHINTPAPHLTWIHVCSPGGTYTFTQSICIAFNIALSDSHRPPHSFSHEYCTDHTNSLFQRPRSMEN